MKKVYLSSTFEDLAPYRQAAYRQIRRLRLDVLSMEDYVAAGQPPLSKCKEDVIASDIYIGIFAWRYGYIPRQNNPDQKSITELEYETALADGKEICIFLLDPNEYWSPAFMDTHSESGDGGQQIRRLRERLQTDHSCSFFSTPDQLASLVSAAIQDFLTREWSQLQRSEPVPISTTTLSELIEIPWYASFSRTGSSIGLSSIDRARETARSVGRIEDLKGRPVATGFLVRGTFLNGALGNRLYMLAPAHVIGPTRGSFGLLVEEAQLHLTVTQPNRPVRLSKLVWSSPTDQLDVSVVELDSQPAHVEGMTVASSVSIPPGLPLISSKRDLEPLMQNSAKQIFMIGHPRGADLRFYMDGCRIVEGDEEQLQYQIDTEAGTGGSPIFDGLWQAIGMHRLRGDIPRLHGDGSWHDVSQGTSLEAVTRALRAIPPDGFP